MDRDENIYIKLEISRDPINGCLNLLTRFDPNAPNFKQDETGFRWSPTKEERQFLNEAFGIIQKKL